MVQNNNQWAKTSVKDLTYHPQYGWTTSAYKSENGLKLLRTSDISSGVINWNTVPVCQQDPPDVDKYLLKDGDILISRAGSVGLSSYIENPPEAVFASYLIRFRAKEDKIRKKYLFYFFQSPKYWNSIGLNEAGIAIPNVNATKLAEIQVDYPENIEEQDKIIAKLDAILPKVKSNQLRIARAKKLVMKFKQAILSAAVTGKLTKNWRDIHELESAEVLLEKIKSWKLINTTNAKQKDKIKTAYTTIENRSDFDLPESWVACQIDHISEVTNGSTPSRKNPNYWNGYIPWVSSGEVINNHISQTQEKITQDGFDNASVKLLPKDTVLIAMIGEGKTRGRSAVLDIEATTNQNIAAVKIDHGFVVPEYLWYWFQFQYENTRNFGGGSSQQALNCQRVRELPFILPPFEEQKEIVSVIKKQFELVNSITEKIEKAEAQVSKLTQAILAKVFKNE